MKFLGFAINWLRYFRLSSQIYRFQDTGKEGHEESLSSRSGFSDQVW